jgi:hypothetical protein
MNDRSSMLCNHNLWNVTLKKDHDEILKRTIRTYVKASLKW